MTATLPNVAYIVASFLFIMSLKGLSQPSTSRRGNLLGTIGMILAIVVTTAKLWAPEVGKGLVLPTISSAGLLAGAIAVGCVIGAILAARVAMTQMPELVAMLHSFVGLAAVLVGIVSKMHADTTGVQEGIAHELEVVIGVFVGAVTLTGSIVAFLKLRGTVGGRPLLLPGRHLLNLVLFAGCVVLGAIEVAALAHGGQAGLSTGLFCLLGVTALSCILGVTLVAAIGGGDMPVVVSMLNSYSG